MTARTRPIDKFAKATAKCSVEVSRSFYTYGRRY